MVPSAYEQRVITANLLGGSHPSVLLVCKIPDSVYPICGWEKQFKFSRLDGWMDDFLHFYKIPWCFRTVSVLMFCWESSTPLIIWSWSHNIANAMQPKIPLMFQKKSGTDFLFSSANVITKHMLIRCTHKLQVKPTHTDTHNQGETQFSTCVSVLQLYDLFWVSWCCPTHLPTTPPINLYPPPSILFQRCLWLLRFQKPSKSS